MKKFVIGAVIALAAMSANASNGIFRIINNSAEAIVQVFVSPPNRQTYGNSDLLGDRVIYPRDSEIVDPGNFTDAENKCVLDVLAIGEHGSKWEKRMDVCNITTWTLTGGRSKPL